MRRLLFSPAAQRGWLALLVVLAAGVVTLACLPASVHGPSLGWDKLNHAAAFMTLAFCGHFAFRERPRSLFWVSFLLLALGVGIELLQMQIPGRRAEVDDVLADALGLCVGLLVAIQLGRRLDRRRRPRKRLG